MSEAKLKVGDRVRIGTSGRTVFVITEVDPPTVGTPIPPSTYFVRFGPVPSGYPDIHVYGDAKLVKVD